MARADGVVRMPDGAAELLRIVIAALVVLGLLLPTIDHHLAERVPGHQHLAPMAAGAGNSHQHAYEQEHHHALSGPLVRIAEAAPAAPSVTPGLAAAASPGEALASGRVPVVIASVFLLHHAAGMPWPFSAAAGILPAAHAVAPDPPPPVFPS